MDFPEIAAAGGGVGRWGLVAKPCDYCTSAQALLFCRTESAHMCMSCDSKIHASGKFGVAHARVWMCEVCEQAPASVTCKADAAALCAACDRGIHSANPLAQRHERFPVVPFYETAESVVKSTAASLKMGTCSSRDYGDYLFEPLVSSYLTGSKESFEDSDNKSIELLFSDTDNYLGFHYPISSEGQFQQKICSATDGVVPVQTVKSTVQTQFPVHSSEKHFEIDFTKSHANPFHNSYAQSLSQNVSSSELDIGVVPDGSSKSEISYSMGTSVDLGGSSSRNQGAQLAGGMDREARVLRYREKRKNRKFEKTIRYASRKAYAETRPRIKGRFAKRTEVDSDVDQMFSSDSMSSFFQETNYGVVPSF